MGQANDGNGDEQVGPESKDALEEPRAGVVGARYSFRCWFNLRHVQSRSV